MSITTQIHSFGVSEQVLEIYDKMDEDGELQAKEEANKATEAKLTKLEKSLKKDKQKP